MFSESSPPTNQSSSHAAELQGQDRIEAEAPSAQNTGWQVRGIACARLTELLTQLRAHLAAGRKPEEFELPQENTHPAILLRELLQKMTGGWKFPLAQEELCHCRSIPTHVVDQAIIAGAHDVNTVRRWTSANTACGTCLPEVQTLLDFRLKK